MASLCLMGLRFSSSVYTRGAPVDRIGCVSQSYGMRGCGLLFSSNVYTRGAPVDGLTVRERISSSAIIIIIIIL